MVFTSNRFQMALQCKVRRELVVQRDVAADGSMAVLVRLDNCTEVNSRCFAHKIKRFKPWKARSDVARTRLVQGTASGFWFDTFCSSRSFALVVVCMSL
jgi:hypothetical protein